MTSNYLHIQQLSADRGNNLKNLIIVKTICFLASYQQATANTRHTLLTTLRYKAFFTPFYTSQGMLGYHQWQLGQLHHSCDFIHG